MLDELQPEKASKIIEPKLLISNGTDKDKIDRPKPTGLVLANVCASWQPDPIIYTLRNINITVQPGEFIGIAGLVGAGKVKSIQSYFNA